MRATSQDARFMTTVLACVCSHIWKTRKSQRKILPIRNNGGGNFLCLSPSILFSAISGSYWAPSFPSFFRGPHSSPSEWKEPWQEHEGKRNLKNNPRKYIEVYSEQLVYPRTSLFHSWSGYQVLRIGRPRDLNSPRLIGLLLWNCIRSFAAGKARPKFGITFAVATTFLGRGKKREGNTPPWSHDSAHVHFFLFPFHLLSSCLLQFDIEGRAAYCIYWREENTEGAFYSFSFPSLSQSGCCCWFYCYQRRDYSTS